MINRCLLAVFTCCTILCGQLAAADKPTTVSRVNVFDFGAKGEGKTDDTSAFQKAMDSFKRAGVGGTVHVPQGNYLCAGRLEIPEGVTLEGIWRIPTAWSQHKGSTILVTDGEGNADGEPFILLGANSTLKGLTIFYPNQTSTNPPKSYPWTVRSTLDNASIIDCLFVNPYQAVDFGTRVSGRHYIRNLYGMPLHKGLFIDNCYDVGRVENVHFWPFWNPDLDGPQSQAVRKYVQENATAFIMARTDWEYMLNTFCWGYKIGYHFVESKSGYANGNFLGIGADGCEVGVQVDASAPYGLLITNGEFVSFNGPDPVCALVGEENIGTVQFMNCAFWGDASRCAKVAGLGTVSFNTCNFVSWDPKRLGNAAVEATGGNLLINGSSFAHPGPHVKLGGDLQSAVITGNRFTGKIKIENSSNAEVQIGLNVGAKGPVEEPNAVVVDDSDSSPAIRLEGEWHTGVGGRDYLGMGHWSPRGAGQNRATFSAGLPREGRYKVSVWYGADPMNDHATNAPWVVKHADGETTVRVNLKQDFGKWNEIGAFKFSASTSATATLSNDADANVLGDAVKFLPE